MFVCNKAIFVNKAHTLCAFIYFSLHSVINSCVTASIAPKTLYRCLPDGVGRYKRQKHQRHPKNPPNTKWAASTKYNFCFAFLAFFILGSNSFVTNSSCSFFFLLLLLCLELNLLLKVSFQCFLDTYQFVLTHVLCQ